MKLKLDENGNVVVQDGKPVYIHDDGKEVPFDAPATVAKIGGLNAEAKAHREAKEAAEAALKPFKDAGIEDAEAAAAALELANNVKDGDLVQAGKVEEIKAAARKSAEEQVAAAAKQAQEQLNKISQERDALQNDLYQEKIGGSFNRSKVIAEKFLIPGEPARDIFGKAFKVEEGKVVAYDNSGNKIYSRARPGELADFDEALETLVDQYPYKDAILKGNNGGGAGTRESNGTGGKTMTRAQYEADPSGGAAKMAEGYTISG